MFQPLTIQTRLGGFYFFYYSIVGTFMPYWNLYLQDQRFNYQEIGVLSSIAMALLHKAFEGKVFLSC